MTIPVLGDSVAATGANDLTPYSSQDWANYAAGVRFLALRALGDEDAADDIAQETILRALRTTIDANKAAIRDPAAFIHGIAKHIIADALRRKYQTLSLEVAETIPAADGDVLDAMVSDEERSRVRLAIRKLPPSERSLLVMSFVRGMSSPEIAERLGESAELIRKRKSRAVERLRAAFFAN